MQTGFFRVETDGRRVGVGLEGLYGGATRTWCWVIGGGPSLRGMPCEEIAASPVAKMGINLAGTGRLRPTIWTAYDRTCRFLTSVYLDACITKVLPVRRAMDVVPGTTVKVCECPNTVFFGREGRVGFADLLAQGRAGIVDWADSMVTAIEIAYRLGFRRLLLAGCEMRVRPAREQLELAAAAGVEYDGTGLLAEFVARCERAGVTGEQLEQRGPARQYHFDEHKPIKAAAQTDSHYFRVAQYLRLSRRNLAGAGMEIISVTPGSRLNDYFPYVPVRAALEEIKREIPWPKDEETLGLYCEERDRRPRGAGPMRDYRPHNWREGSGKESERAAEVVCEGMERGGAAVVGKGERLLAALEELRGRRGDEG